MIRQLDLMFMGEFGETWVGYLFGDKKGGLTSNEGDINIKGKSGKVKGSKIY